MRNARLLILAALLSACGPKCLKQECRLADSTCSQIVGWIPIGNNPVAVPIYSHYPCQEQQCWCVEREVEK